MDLLTTTFIGIGLAMDALAVSVTSGIVMKENIWGNAIKIALFFGFFQALMPLIGWIAGIKLNHYIANFDHWIAFGLLSMIGIKMIYDSVFNEERHEINPYDYIVLLILAVATSIDALAVGVSFAFLKISIVQAIITIGLITFLLSLIGVLIGNKLGALFRNKIEIVGGFILIVIGFKILLTS